MIFDVTDEGQRNMMEHIENVKKESDDFFFPNLE